MTHSAPNDPVDESERMKVSTKDFRVKEGGKVNLRKWPTNVDPVYTSKEHYKELLEEHVERLSALPAARETLLEIASLPSPDPGAQSAAALAWAKERGLAVSGEVTPHHLALCEDDVPGQDANFKVNPPLRGKADRDALVRALNDGVIDAVATDHAPHSPEAKAAGWASAPPGVLGLETAVGVVLTKLVHPGKMSKKRWVESMSAFPAKLLGLKSKGSLKPGMDADAAVIAPAKSWAVPESFLSKSRNSPFIGMRLKGQVRTTLVGGRVVHAL